MKTAGYILLTVAFLAAAFVSVLTEENEIDWRWFVPAFVLGAVGVALAQLGLRQQTRQVGTLTANVHAVRSSIDRILTNLTGLDGEKADLHPYALHTRIDELFVEDLAAFVDARESIAHVHGLAAYAAVMSEFAAGERYLNRVWSASVDCYIDDAHEYLGRAKEQFVKTRDALAALN